MICCEHNRGNYNKKKTRNDYINYNKLTLLSNHLANAMQIAVVGM